MKRITLLIWLFLCVWHIQAQGIILKKIATPFQIGDTEVWAILYEVGDSRLTFFNMHDDENTGVEAAIDVILEKGGRLIELQHSGKRNLEFSLNGVNYAVDPNRIFTDAGLEATLKRYSEGYSVEAFNLVKSFANNLLTTFGLADASLIVTVHNNTEESYSVKSYMKGAVYENDAALVAFHQDSDEDDFFFVTEERFYNMFSSSGFNVVLQNNATVTDDGSLSVYAGFRGIPYINAEAQHGHLETQIVMLKSLIQFLSSP